MADNIFTCRVCNYQTDNSIAFGLHIARKHNPKEYYDTFIDSNIHKCPFCDSECKFVSLTIGYRTTCMSAECLHKMKSKRASNPSNETKTKRRSTCLKRYGSETYNNSSKRIETCKEKYGVDYNETFETKRQQTKLQKYGDAHFSNRTKAENTCLIKYGTKYSAQSEQVKAKIRKTKLQKYGDETFTNREKYKNTCEMKYGVTSTTLVKEFQDKSRATKLQKYGDETFTNREKAKETLKLRYGIENPMESAEFCENIKVGNMKRFGVPFAFQSPKIKSKIKETMLRKYGVSSFAQSEEYAHHKKHKYVFQGIGFDSTDEVKLYKFCLENEIPVKYQPCSFEFTDSFGKNHVYIPDFEIAGKLYEVKGNHLWRDGHLYFPYRKKLSENQLAEIDAHYAGKDRCMNEHNVKVLLSSELDEFINKLKEAS